MGTIAIRRFAVTALIAGGFLAALTIAPGARAANYLDTTPPETTVTGGTSGLVSSTSASINFVSSERRSSFVCAMDGINAVSCSSPFKGGGLSQGAHKFYVVAIDRAGNVDPTAATRSFTVDTVAPDTTITSAPSGTVTSTSASISFSGSGGPSGYQCQLDGSAWSGCSSPKTYAGLSDATHNFQVRALDAAGNVDPSPAANRWTVQAATSGGTSSGGTTTTGTTTGSDSCDPGLLSPTSWPAACWRPYADTSPFNRPVPASPTLASNSAAVVARMTGWGNAQTLVVGGPSGSGDDYKHPVYYASASDPVYKIHCTQWTSSCEIEGMSIHIPAAARPAGGDDGHMAVIDQAGGWEYDFWQVATVPLPASGGTINVSHGGRTRWGTTDADGLGSNATAAHFGLDAGSIRAEEWDAATSAGGAINHALFMTTKCSAGFSVYPADPGTTAASCSSFGATNADAPPVGGHFYLDLSDAQIDALSVPAWKKPILKALAHYGMYVGDTYANHNWSFGISSESDQQYLSMGQPGKFAALGKKWGVGTWNGNYVFDINSGVDWAAHLKLLAPCVAQGTC
ncbi:MAG: hypothetical protein U0R52_09875 [Solirubrobacterales bacterium]